MSTSGYSGTPLLVKLGIQPGMKLLLMDPPPEYFQLLEQDLSAQLATGGEKTDLVHAFVKNKTDFLATMKTLEPLIKKNSSIIIWVSWYKRSARMGTDLTEDDIRNHALKNGLVDIKVCAVSETWSGLKLVVPKALRK